MLVKIEARILIFPGTDFHFPSTSVPPGTFFRLCVRPRLHWFIHLRAQGWRRGVVVSRVRRMNEVNARRARLVLGLVTVFYHLGM